MKGTAVLYKEDQQIIILRDVEKTVMKEIESQRGSEQCICFIEDKEVDFGQITHAIWMDRADIGD